MQLTRRRFLATGAAGLALATLGPKLRLRLADARGLLTDPVLQDVVGRALAAAKAAGATWADVRIVRRRWESVETREARVQRVAATDSYGLGVRVVASGTWGFAATSRVDGAEGEAIARRAVEIAQANATVRGAGITLAPVTPRADVWQTPLIKDPFKISLEDKADFLLSINAEALKVKGAKFASSSLDCVGEWKLLATSDDIWVEQNQIRVAPGYSVTAVDAATGQFESRGHEIAPRQAGWEYVEGSTMLADARRVAEDAVEKLRAPSVKPGRRDLILAPTNLWLTIHESIGHPTELDRVMGYEANFAGTSFLRLEDRGKLQYGSKVLSVTADKTEPGALATCGYDDDGVPTQRWDLLRDGKFVGWQTTRDQAGWIGEKSSRGSCYAEDHRSFPFQRMPNVSIVPGTRDLGIADLVAATDDGILITGTGSYSIDHQRRNFQFGGQTFHEVKGGKVRGPLRDVAYQATTLDFWRSLDLLGGAREWQLGGAMYDGKGEPMQSNAVSHGCPPARFHQVNILNTNQRGA